MLKFTVIAVLMGAFMASAANAGSCTVRYGGMGKYKSKRLSKGRLYKCSNSLFGDPAHGVPKQCFNGSRVVAREGKMFMMTACRSGNPPGFTPPPPPKPKKCTISYGADGKYVQKSFNVMIPFKCSNSVFGRDPAYGKKKLCYNGALPIAVEGRVGVATKCLGGSPPKPAPTPYVSRRVKLCKDYQNAANAQNSTNIRNKCGFKPGEFQTSHGVNGGHSSWCYKEYAKLGYNKMVARVAAAKKTRDRKLAVCIKNKGSQGTNYCKAQKAKIQKEAGLIKARVNRPFHELGWAIFAAKKAYDEGRSRGCK